ncbi:hypothetical protein [Lentzea terrae]|uniref:hypothetical protein n=1 Tax=Lentzea terrae TaxID=2200761 RepID=UPI000DD3517E|nr:hypothetical protein [Lentzea terrae]
MIVAFALSVPAVAQAAPSETTAPASVDLYAPESPSGAPAARKPAPRAAKPARTSTPSKDSGPVKHCVASVVTHTSTCYQTFREAIDKATGGLITDAPVAAAELSKADVAKVNAADVPLVEIGYSGTNFTGSTFTISGTDCAGGGTWYIHNLADYGWDDAFSSVKTFSQCFATHYLDPNERGSYYQWYADTPLADFGGGWNRQISSISWVNGPSVNHLLDACGRNTDSCDFRANPGVSESYSDFHEVAKANNCASTTQTGSVSWSDTTGGKYTVGVEVSVTAGFKVEALAKLEATVKTSFSREWSWGHTFSRTDNFSVPPGRAIALQRATKLQSVGGSYELHFGSRWWGHYIWYISPFVGTGPVPQDGGVTRWIESSANCPAGKNGTLTIG